MDAAAAGRLPADLAVTGDTDVDGTVFEVLDPTPLPSPILVGPTITANGPMTLSSPSSTPSLRTGVGWMRFTNVGSRSFRLNSVCFR